MNFENPTINSNEDDDGKQEDEVEIPKKDESRYETLLRVYSENNIDKDTVDELKKLPDDLKLVAEKHFNRDDYDMKTILEIVRAQQEIDNLPEDLRNSINSSAIDQNPLLALTEFKADQEADKIPDEFKDLRHKIKIIDFFHAHVVELQHIAETLKGINDLPPKLRNFAYTNLQNSKDRSLEFELKEAIAFGEIDKLPEDLKSIANEYKEQYKSYNSALKSTIARDKINKLPENLRVIAEKYLNTEHVVGYYKDDTEKYKPEEALELALLQNTKN
ncbi:MAG: hypothetical protein PHZ07_02325 [Patescibacteria group bacterium]|nr:hypothetical protein [Patescibacteria group bacterium]MDD4304237.1 hypothetical protein [Patescibacteria group bacterium]MDD4695291.1 hypothetical protein [Patescibacteria group bacterium]